MLEVADVALDDVGEAAVVVQALFFELFWQSYSLHSVSVLLRWKKIVLLLEEEISRYSLLRDTLEKSS